MSKISQDLFVNSIYDKTAGFLPKINTGKLALKASDYYNKRYLQNVGGILKRIEPNTHGLAIEGGEDAVKLWLKRRNAIADQLEKGLRFGPEIGTWEQLGLDYRPIEALAKKATNAELAAKATLGTLGVAGLGYGVNRRIGRSLDDMQSR